MFHAACYCPEVVGARRCRQNPRAGALDLTQIPLVMNLWQRGAPVAVAVGYNYIALSTRRLSGKREYLNPQTSLTRSCGGDDGVDK